MSEGSSTTWQARDHYYKVLQQVMYAEKTSFMNSNYEGSHKGLQALYIMVCPYIQEDEATLIRASLKELRRKVLHLQSLNKRDQNMQASYLQGREVIDETLFDLSERLHRAAKNVFLPTGSAHQGAFDERQFLKDSDL
jgi:hypothetical protein